MAADMSYRLGWIDESIQKRTLDILQQAKLPVTPPKGMTVEKFRNIMAVSNYISTLILVEALALGPDRSALVTEQTSVFVCPALAF
jgi:3-dehydroquinate synthase